MSAEILALSDVHASYGSGDVLQGVSLSIAEGEIVAVIGRNGVGKTALMKTVIGILPARPGSIRFGGDEVTSLPARKRSLRGIGYVPQGRQIFPELTVEENLLTGEQVNSLSKNRRLRYDLVFAHFPILRERRGQLGATLSGGQQQMLAIGRALVGGPRLLLLDEPSAGLQPSIIQAIGASLRELNRTEKLTILFVEQNVGLIGALAHRGYAMDKGRIVTELQGSRVRDRDFLIRYLAV
jgi:branched-chain amino acid transport system ATP-binding protein